MLSSTLWRALTTPVTYALVAVLVGTAVMQVKYVNKALARFDSTQVIPVQFVMFTLSVIIGSAVLYRDFEKATADSVGKFIGGCLLTFFGVFLITSGRPRRDDDDEEEESDEEGEERIGLIDQEPSGEEHPAQEGARKRPASKVYQNGDGASHETPSDSRRSSRVSFVDPSQPRTPHRFSVSSYQAPSVRLAPSAPASEISAEETPLLSNPWKGGELLQSVRHPGLSNTTSSPVLPSEAQISTEPLKPPSTLGRTSSQGNVHTHPNHQHGPTPPQADVRPMTPARHSISRMMPGPFISPISGGLSAVVADTMRRGIESPSKPKRTRLGLRRSKSGSHRLTQSRDGNENGSETPSAKNGEEGREISKSLDTEPDKTWSRMTRARSLSNTLGEYFRGKRQKTDATRDTDGDEEAGPSGS
jgi:magnesium transporter